VAVVFGGRSTEHGISIVSAGGVLAALDPQKYDVVALGITPEGNWVPASTTPQALSNRTLPAITDGGSDVQPDDGLTVDGRGDQSRVAIDRSVAVLEVLSQVDVVFPVLHGRFGEDGTIQGLLEMVGVPYVGSGVFASAAAMDKAHTKRLLEADGLPVGTYQVLRKGADASAVDIDRLGLPIFVKPTRSGSSVGITKVTSAGDLQDALDEAFAHDDKVIIESAVVGREIECGVLTGRDGVPQASLPAEIRLVRGHDWYDFEAKYLDDACEFDIPADIGPQAVRKVQEMACRAFESLDCAGLARVDFFMRSDGSLVINEINTMPGFTPISMYPKMWAASGVDYPELIDRLIAAALK
jgi:D-alanine-D-alanine ligase